MSHDDGLLNSNVLKDYRNVDIPKNTNDCTEIVKMSNSFLSNWLSASNIKILSKHKVQYYSSVNLVFCFRESGKRQEKLSETGFIRVASRHMV